MKAKIFYLSDEQRARAGKRDALAAELAGLLRKHIYSGIEVEELPVLDCDPEKAGGNAPAIAREYFDLLQASMVKVNDFCISVEDPEGSPWYMGYEGPVAVTLRKELLDSVLPAVAVMGRMVMLPQRIQDALDCPMGFTCFPKPLDVQGVVLVDFRDAKSKLSAVQQVEEQLSSDIVRLCRRYMSVNKIHQPEFDETLAEMIGADRDYLESHRDEILTVSVELEPKVVSGPVRLGQRSRVEIEIRKPPEKALGPVRVQVAGPLDAMPAPFVAELNFSAEGEAAQRIEFEVTAQAPPFCPLEVIFEPGEVADACPPFPIPVILDVAAG
jgi:hypothetical protein